MPERAQWLGTALSGVAALVYLALLLWCISLVITGEWQMRIQLPDAPWPMEFVILLVGVLLLALLASALACAWCGLQWWNGHTHRARVGSWVCFAAGLLLFPISGGGSVFLLLPALAALFWRRSA